jgi:hypothetical protein
LYSHNIQMMADEDDGVETEDEYEIEMPPSPSELTSIPLPNVTSHSPSAAPSNTTHPETQRKRTRKQQHVKDSRARKRAKKQAQQSLELRNLKAVVLKRRQGLKPIAIEAAAEQLSVASSGWVGARLANDKSTHTLEEVTQAPHHLHHIQWDGV